VFLKKSRGVRYPVRQENGVALGTTTNKTKQKTNQENGEGTTNYNLMSVLEIESGRGCEEVKEIKKGGIEGYDTRRPGRENRTGNMCDADNGKRGTTGNRNATGSRSGGGCGNE
jgi:hypothetical protein